MTQTQEWNRVEYWGLGLGVGPAGHLGSLITDLGSESTFRVRKEGTGSHGVLRFSKDRSSRQIHILTHIWSMGAYRESGAAGGDSESGTAVLGRPS